jgi:hypothetical protein
MTGKAIRRRGQRLGYAPATPLRSVIKRFDIRRWRPEIGKDHFRPGLDQSAAWDIVENVRGEHSVPGHGYRLRFGGRFGFGHPTFDKRECHSARSSSGKRSS